MMLHFYILGSVVLEGTFSCSVIKPDLSKLAEVTCTGFQEGFSLLHMKIICFLLLKGLGIVTQLLSVVCNHNVITSWGNDIIMKVKDLTEKYHNTETTLCLNVLE